MISGWACVSSLVQRLEVHCGWVHRGSLAKYMNESMMKRVCDESSCSPLAHSGATLSMKGSAASRCCLPSLSLPISLSLSLSLPPNPSLFPHHHSALPLFPSAHSFFCCSQGWLLPLSLLPSPHLSPPLFSPHIFLICIAEDQRGQWHPSQQACMWGIMVVNHCYWLFWSSRTSRSHWHTSHPVYAYALASVPIRQEQFNFLIWHPCTIKLNHFLVTLSWMLSCKKQKTKNKAVFLAASWLLPLK